MVIQWDIMGFYGVFLMVIQWDIIGLIVESMMILWCFKWDFSSDSFMDLSSDTTGIVPQSAFDAVGVWVMYRTSFNGCAIYL